MIYTKNQMKQRLFCMALCVLAGAAWSGAQEECPEVVDTTLAPEAAQSIKAALHALYEEGSAKRAAEMFRSAAEQGLPQAQFAYAACCRRGVGVEKNESEAVKWYRAAAEQGYEPAMAFLASCYMNGKGVEKDEEKGLAWMRRAAPKNDYALYQLGSSYLNGKGGLEVDGKKALELVIEAAKRGHALSQNAVGWIYKEGLGVDENVDEAVKWFRLAAAQGQQNALTNLAWCYDYCLPSDEMDRAEIYKLYRAAAEQGFVNAYAHVGECFDDGDGVKQNKHVAVMWFKLGVEHNSWQAQYELGRAYMDADVLDYDPVEAARLYRLAALAGNPNGMAFYAGCCLDGVGVEPSAERDAEAFRLCQEAVKKEKTFSYAWARLGEFYESGRGVEADPVKARQCYITSLENGVEPRSLRYLSRCLYLGIGGEKNLDKAIELWNKGAQIYEYGDCMNELGVCCELGEGMPQDLVKAVMWYRRAARDGSAVGRYNLARCYELGIGVKKDLNAAVEWYYKSAHRAFRPAMAALERLGQKSSVCFKKHKFHMYLPQGPKTPPLATAAPADPTPLRRILLGVDSFAYNYPFDPKLELIDMTKSDPSPEGAPPEKTTGVLNGELVYAGDALMAAGEAEAAVVTYRKAAETWSSDAYVRLAYCAARGLGMPQDRALAGEYLAKARQVDNEWAYLVTEALSARRPVHQ